MKTDTETEGRKMRIRKKSFTLIELLVKITCQIYLYAVY